LKALQSLRDDLVGVEVAVLRQPAAEEDMPAACLVLSQRPVALVKLSAGGCRHGIERLAGAARRLVANARLGMLLPRDMLDLDGSGEWPLVRVVDLHARLAETLSERNELELQ